MPSGKLKVRWLKGAIKSLEIEAEHIAREDPRAAAEVVRKIYEATNRLEQYPASGRAGRVLDTRELVIVGTPYIVPYRVKGMRIEILRVFHGSRRWPTSL